MTQRKLTKRELQKVSRAVWYLRSLARVRGDKPYTTIVVNDLEAMASNGTTDGKPWIEPQPEIGEGYRYAIESDVNRLDVERWDTKSFAWHVRDASRRGEPLDKEITYRVPADRIPTDEDAVGRPTVMVMGNIADGWHARTLLAVTAMGFLVKSGDGFTNWKQARFPYPGELD
jgi:hypothetical protein